MEGPTRINLAAGLLFEITFWEQKNISDFDFAL